MNIEDLKRKQAEVCQIISQIWDAESLDIILGSVQNIIRVKRLVMMVDTSCGPSQVIMDQQPSHAANEEEQQSHGADEGQHVQTEEHESNDEEGSQSDIGEECQSDIGEEECQSDIGEEECQSQIAEECNHILVENSPVQSIVNVQYQPMMMNEEGEYVTQIICDTPAPPRISIFEQLEDSDSDSLFDDLEDIILSEDNDDEQDEPYQQEQQDRQQNERDRVVAEYMKMPMSDRNAQCPFPMTAEEIETMTNNDLRQDFQYMNAQLEALQDMYNSPSLRSSSTFSQSNYFIPL